MPVQLPASQHHLCFLGQLPRLLQQALLLLHGAHQGAVQALIQLLCMLTPLPADVPNLHEGVDHLPGQGMHTGLLLQLLLP
jgi:hypothetical protein